MSINYSKAGVNLEAGYESVEKIKKHINATKRLGMMGGIGSFGGLFDLSVLGLKEPVLVSGTDGVGTKLKLAFMMDKHDTIGIDAVAMCVNDIIAQGAEPLFFLDYIAVGKNYPDKIEAIVSGVSKGCVESGCALIGGETAEMPGMYDEDEYDVAGFAVGAVEKSKIITNDLAKEGDVVIALPSSGVHSNGFSLVRKIVLADNGLDLNEYYEELGDTLGNTLLTPTRLYVKSVLAVLKEVNVHGIAHITGGGFYENMPRCVSNGLGFSIKKGSWKIPAIFPLLARLGKIEEDEMYNVFNMGVGMIVVVDKSDVEKTLAILKEQGEEATVIGEIVKQEGVSFHD